MKSDPSPSASLEKAKPTPSTKKSSKTAAASKPPTPPQPQPAAPELTQPQAAAPVVMMQQGLSKLAVFCLFLIVVLSMAIAAVAWWFWPQYQSTTQRLETAQQNLVSQLDGSADASSGLAKTLETLRVGVDEGRRERLLSIERQKRLETSLEQVNQKLQQQQQQQVTLATQANERVQQQNDTIDSLIQRLDAHNQRLMSLSNTSREDWLLAEAEYLLRLANQRMMVDRNARSALGLLESADAILKELDMPDLFPIRKAVADDVGALKLAAVVDREGIYLKLMGLANNLDQLPTLRKAPDIQLQQVDMSEEALSGDDYWEKAKNLGSSTLEYLGNYVRIQDSTQPIEPLLPPEIDGYLRQNIRFALEQAQLAMLREEASTYKASLQQALELLRTHYPGSDQVANLMQEVHELMQMPIAIELPNISGSQERLHAYIERLHKLGDTKE